MSVCGVSVEYKSEGDPVTCRRKPGHSGQHRGRYGFRMKKDGPVFYETIYWSGRLPPEGAKEK